MKDVIGFIRLWVWVVVFLCVAPAWAIRQIPQNSTDISTTFPIRNMSTGAMYTGLTVTSFDLYYHINNAALSAKTDAGSGSATAHSDNTAFSIGEGYYEVDWPDAIWTAAPGTMIDLVVEWDVSNHYAEYIQVQISTAVSATAAANMEMVFNTDFATNYDTTLNMPNVNMVLADGDTPGTSSEIVTAVQAAGTYLKGLYDMTQDNGGGLRQFTADAVETVAAALSVSGVTLTDEQVAAIVKAIEHVVP